MGRINKKFQLLLFSILIMISLMTSAIGITYAWFGERIEEEVNVTSGTLSIAYEKDEVISASNLKPATKEQVLEAYNAGSCKYQVNGEDEVYDKQVCYFNNINIVNTGTLASTVSIILSNVTNTYSDNLKYQVFKNVPETLTGKPLQTETLLEGLPSEEYLSRGSTIVYTLLIWLDENAGVEDQNKTYSAVIDSFGTQTNEDYVIFEGVMVDEQNNILPNVKLMMHSNPKYTVTDENGYFDFGYVETGEHTIIALDQEEKEILNDTFKIEKGIADLARGKEVTANINVAVKIIKTSEKIKEIILLGSDIEGGEDPEEEPKEKIITPILLSGMIPIKYDKNKKSWVKASSDNKDDDWYNYDNKKWANIALVSEDTRASYMASALNTTINESDILGYYVWIPRYKYKLFNVDFAASTYDKNGNCKSNCPKEIEIMFETIDTNISDGTCNNTHSKPTNDCYYTHPAFWWDEDSDGTRDLNEEIPGFWFSKFQISGSENNPTILPNMQTVHHQNLHNQQQMAENIISKKYIDQVAINLGDSHITKNLEWGAVAYLSHSTYGINGKIRNNNIDAMNSKYTDGMSLTGCSAAIENEPQKKQTHCDYTYDEETIGVLASTTGNIYGIYDMAGTNLEHVMGIMKNRIGYLSYAQTGFNMFNLSANSKHVNAYTYTSSASNKNALKITILGDATGETNSWYQNGIDYPHSSINTVFARGGTYVGNQFTFESVNGNGSFDYNISCRSVIVSSQKVL